jgi:RNA-directed DNA polymerase
MTHPIPILSGAPLDAARARHRSRIFGSPKGATSIDHLLLMDRLALYVRDRNVLNLLGQYLRRTAERGGWFWDCERGISLGCPLSPLVGAFFLDQLDRQMTATGLFYVRFMDDILVLAPTRWG